MDKIWLKHYPKGVPAEIDVNEYASVRDVFEESCAQVRRAARVFVHGQVDHLRASSTTLSAAFGAWLQARGCTKGARVALMMPNILQYPVCLFGIAARRLHGRQRQSALHGARARASAQRLRRRGDRRRREFRAHAWPKCVGKTKVRAGRSSPASASCSGFKGLLVDFVLRHVKKMVPAWSHARRDPAVRRARRRPQAQARARRRSGTTTSRSCSTPAARPASPRARCCCTATSSPTCCRRARGCGRSSTRTGARSSSRRCRSITSFR